MDPKFYGKLLTLHRRGNGVDVEALRDRFPIGGAPEKAPRWDLLGIEGCGGGNRVSWCSWMFSGVSVFIGIFGVGFTSRGLIRLQRIYNF